MDMMALRRSIMMGSYKVPMVEYTATGNPLTFLTDLAKPLRSVLASWQPRQSGTGDPSPSNVRSISGVEGVTVWHSGSDTSNPTTYAVEFPVLGKNLLDPSLFQNLTNRSFVNYTNGELVYFSTSYNASDYVPIKGNTEYTLHAGMQRQSTAGCAFYDENKQYISGFQTNTAIATYYTFTSPSNAVYMRFSDSSEIVPFDSVWFEYGDTPSPYEPYTRTVYGGTLDLTTGVLTATHYLARAKKSDFGDKSTGALDYRQTAMQTDTYPESASGVNWNLARQQQLFNYGKVANAYSETSYGDYIGVMVTQPPYGCYMRISDNVYQAMGENDTAEISYELATPVVLATLTPTQITALLGNNTMWADADDLSVTYLKKG